MLHPEHFCLHPTVSDSSLTITEIATYLKINGKELRTCTNPCGGINLEGPEFDFELDFDSNPEQFGVDVFITEDGVLLDSSEQAYDCSLPYSPVKLNNIALSGGNINITVVIDHPTITRSTPFFPLLEYEVAGKNLFTFLLTLHYRRYLDLLQLNSCISCTFSLSLHGCMMEQDLKAP